MRKLTRCEIDMCAGGDSCSGGYCIARKESVGDSAQVAAKIIVPGFVNATELRGLLEFMNGKEQHKYVYMLEALYQEQIPEEGVEGNSDLSEYRSTRSI